MVMVKYLANTATCPLGDFACALGGADTDVLAGVSSAFADIAGGFGWMQCDKVARAFANTLGGRSSTFAGSLADVSGASADVATGAGLMGLLIGGRLRRAGRLLRGLGLAVLTSGIQAEDSKCECEGSDGWF
jgi:hypothetical protein